MCSWGYVDPCNSLEDSGSRASFAERCARNRAHMARNGLYPLDETSEVPLSRDIRAGTSYKWIWQHFESDQPDIREYHVRFWAEKDNSHS